MNTSTRFLVTTALAGLMGLTALAPGAYAQTAPAAPAASGVAQPDDNGGMRGDAGPRGKRPGEHRDAARRGGIAGLICSTDGAAQLETRLADIAIKLALTAEQQPLFDAYRTAALTAQTSFAESCAKPQPAAAAPAPDALAMLKDRQARQTAELAALNAVLPSFEALYNSLTDAQKAVLQPLVGPHRGGDHGPRGDDRDGARAGRGDDHQRGRNDDCGRGGRSGMIAPAPTDGGTIAG